MSNNLQIMQQLQSALPAAARAKLASGKLNTDLAGGITAGFAIVSLRGKNWRVKHHGEERVLMTPDGRAPAYALEVVLVKASPHISKVWYEQGYTEGSNAPPDCWSVNGIAPDPASPKLQSRTCAGCKWNAWGSSRTQGGSGKGKDCADSKRLAIVPAGDIPNEVHGGPMLLRIPPASLGDVLAYANNLAQMGIPYNAVVTELSFDLQAEYPKVQFKALRPLSDADYAKVEELGGGGLVERILESAVDHVQTDGVDTSHTGPGPSVAPGATPGVKPVQQPQQPPAGFKPVPPPTAAQAAPPSNVVPLATPSAPVPTSAPTPHDADTGEVLEEEPDAKREAMRKLGLTEDAINAAIGPPKMRPAVVAQPEPVDPRIAQLKAAGLTDAQIEAALKVSAGATSGSQQSETTEEKKRRTRRTKAEMEALRAGTAEAQSKANGAAVAPTPAPASTPLEEAIAAKGPAPDASADEPGTLPADFDAALDALLAPKG